MPSKGIKLLDHDEILAYEEIIDIVKILVDLGIKKVRITGGEPLVRKDIIKLIGDLRKIIGIEHLALTTNGILLGDYLNQLKDKGVEALNISIDSLNSSRFRKITGGGDLKVVLQAVKKAIMTGFDSVKINTVISNYLDDSDVREFIRLTDCKFLNC